MICSKCHEVFICGAKNPNEKCWCMALPPLDPIPPQYEDCLCSKCLSLFIKKKTSSQEVDLPPDSNKLKPRK